MNIEPQKPWVFYTTEWHILYQKCMIFVLLLCMVLIKLRGENHLFYALFLFFFSAFFSLCCLFDVVSFFLYCFVFVCCFPLAKLIYKRECNPRRLNQNLSIYYVLNTLYRHKGLFCICTQGYSFTVSGHISWAIKVLKWLKGIFKQ